MATLEVKNDYMLGIQNEKTLHITLIEQQKEIERLNNIINKAIERLTLKGDIQEKDVIEVFGNAIKDTLNILKGEDNE